MDDDAYRDYRDIETRALQSEERNLNYYDDVLRANILDALQQAERDDKEEEDVY
jgi:hypothetical protein